MQRHGSALSSVFLLLGALYVSAAAHANPSEVTTSAVVSPSDLTIAPLGSSTVATSPELPAAPHIALLLPLNSPFFSKFADAVRQGFLAAASKNLRGLPVRVYPCVDEVGEVNILYYQAVQAGAVAVAGPLTRDGVAMLANSAEMTVPTLALNMMDGPRSDQFYFFGLPAEAEARQAAMRATNTGLLSVTIVSTNSPLSQRLAQAFADEWQNGGGIVQAEIVYSGSPSVLKSISPDMGSLVFLAAESDKARLMRPFIDSSLPVYTTSQIFSGNGNALVNHDLADIRFLDMPWMLQPDHPAVMVYPRSSTPLTPDLERLYALGIDAYRLLNIMHSQTVNTALPLDGVTGRITLNGHQFQREALFATIKQGMGVPLENRRRP